MGCTFGLDMYIGTHGVLGIAIVIKPVQLQGCNFVSSLLKESWVWLKQEQHPTTHSWTVL